MTLAPHAPTATPVPAPVPLRAMALCADQWCHALTHSGVGGYPRVAREVLTTLTAAAVVDLDRHAAAVEALAAALSDTDRMRLRRQHGAVRRAWWRTHTRP